MESIKSAEEIAERYNSLSVIVDDDDKWHLITKKKIGSFINSVFQQIPDTSNFKILNAGSGGFSYGLDESNILHVDIADKHLSKLPNSIVADVQDLPLSDESFDMIICVGSVLNYCDPIRVAKEFKRVLKPGSHLILDYENSYTLELVFKKTFNQSAVYIETFFDAHGDKESIWYFSEQYINRLFGSYDFEKLKQQRFHILSPLIYRITRMSNFSASFANWDGLLSRVPFLKRFSSNVVTHFQLKRNN